MDAYRFLCPEEGLVSTERASDRVLSLPLYPGLDEAVVTQVAEVLKAAVGKESEGGL